MSDGTWVKIQSLPLNLVKDKLRSKKSWWWLLWHNLDKIEVEYRQFLYLIAKNPGQTVVPWSEAMDDFWHEHILDTAKYEKDCNEIFGRYIHHNPHLSVGSRPQVVAFAQTKKMYKDAFGGKVKNSSYSSHSDVSCSVMVFCGSDSHSSSHSSHSHGSSCGASCGSSGSSCGASCGASCGGGGGGCGGD